MIRILPQPPLLCGESLKNELKELKEHIKNKNEGSSSSSSEDTSDDGDESEEEGEDEEKPISVLDIFKTTILKKTSKTTKSTYLCKDSLKPSLRRSKLIETKTQKILKERIQMRNKIKKWHIFFQTLKLRLNKYAHKISTLSTELIYKEASHIIS